MSHPLEKETGLIEQAAEKLVAAALKGGADAAEVCATFGRGTKITMEKQDFHLGSSDMGYQVGLRVLVKDRQGFASCNTLSQSVLKDTVSKAVEIAQFSLGNRYFRILASPHIPKEAPIDALWDHALADVSFQTQKEWAQLLFAEAMKDNRFRLNEASVSIGSHAALIFNSLGTRKIEAQTNAAWSVMGMAIDGENITSFDYFSRLLRFANQAPHEIVSSVRSFRDSMIASLNHGPASNYKGVVAFHPRALLDIFVSPIEYHLNGRNVLDGTTRWKTDMGSAVLPTHFTLTDSPWDTSRNGATFFDREGTPTRNRRLINEGKLEGLCLDNYSGLGLGLETSGNAVGGPSAPPSVGSHCLCLSGGTTPLKQLFKDNSHSGKGLLLVHRFSGQSDPITGDFSGVAKGAQWFIGGEAAYYVRETLISGNIFDVMKECIGLSNEVSVVDSGDSSPFGLFGGVSVTSSSTKIM